MSWRGSRNVAHPRRIDDGDDVRRFKHLFLNLSFTDKMKRQKLKVFNSCRHSSTMNNVGENKSFTVVFNRRTLFGITLLLSTLLPLNQAAPMAKSSTYSNGFEAETTASISPQSTTMAVKVVDSKPNATFQNGDDINDKLGSPPAASATSATVPIDEPLSNDKPSPAIEYNHNVVTIKSDSSEAPPSPITTEPATGSSSNNYLDKNNHFVATINSPLSESHGISAELHPTGPVVLVHDIIDDENTPILPSTKQSATAYNDNLMTTTTTFIPHSHSTPNGLSDSSVESNKNPTQETIFTTESSVHTSKPSSIPADTMTTTTLKALGDNVSPSFSTSSLTEIDGAPSLNVNVEEHLNGQLNMQSEASNPLSTESSIQTNDNDKDRLTTANAAAAADADGADGGGTDENGATSVTNENSKRVDETAAEPKLGHVDDDGTETTILIKSASSPIDNPTTTIARNSNHGGKMTKVFDEEKLNGKKAKQENLGNNNKKYNNKNNKDKSKQKANEEGGVNDPNEKLNDNLLMETTSMGMETATTPTAPAVFVTERHPTTDLISFAWGDGSAVHHTSTVRSMTTHFLDDNSADKTKASHPQSNNEMHTSTMINADVTTNFTPLNMANNHISSTLNSFDVISTTTATSTTSEISAKTANTQIESTTNEKHDDDIGQKTVSTTLKPEIETRASIISETSSWSEKQLITETATPTPKAADPVEVAENNESNKQHSHEGGNETNKTDNEFMRSHNAANDIKTTNKPTTERASILDYDKSSEEIFDIVRETSTPKTEISSPNNVGQKLAPDSKNDEFFLPADDLDTDITTISTSAATTTITTTAADIATKTTTTMQSTISINTESSIVRPNTDGSMPTIVVPIPNETTVTKQQSTELNKASTISRDSDTIFYISNTEVKVVESSVPTPNSKQENQFFPALFEEDVIIDFPGKNSTGWSTGLDGPVDKYEEDIILSPMKSNFDPTKLNDENLSISYVGESFIDIKEATSDDTSAGSDSNAQNNDISSESRENARSFGENAISSNVIIEPVIIPDVQQSIGVPIIGALPSQINIQDLDYKNDAVQLNNSGNSISSHYPTHPGDNLQKAQELTAELPKTDSEEATALIDDDKIDLNKNETQKTNITATATVTAITNVTELSESNDSIKLRKLNCCTVSPILNSQCLRLSCGFHGALFSHFK